MAAWSDELVVRSSTGTRLRSVCAAFTSVTGGLCLVAAALLGRVEVSGQVVSRVDQRDMGERLREVSEQPARDRIVLFGKQAER